MTRTPMDLCDDSLAIVGVRIAGKYLVTEAVEQTCFSAVYRAEHVLWRRSVAIKVFKVAATVSREVRQVLLERFLREGAILAELSERCSAICQARDVGVLKSPAGSRLPFLVLEWLEGESLEC